MHDIDQIIFQETMSRVDAIMRPPMPNAERIELLKKLPRELAKWTFERWTHSDLARHTQEQAQGLTDKIIDTLKQIPEGADAIVIIQAALVGIKHPSQKAQWN